MCHNNKQENTAKLDEELNEFLKSDEVRRICAINSIVKSKSNRNDT